MMYPPYFDQAVCPKCRDPYIRTDYEADSYPSWATFDTHPERMRRTCPHCEYVWYERPLGYTQEDEDAFAQRLREWNKPRVEKLEPLPRCHWWRRA